MATRIGSRRTAPKKNMKRRLRVDKMDTLFSKLVRSLAGWKCELCGSTGIQLHCHHFVGRRYLQTRYLLENAISVCVSCHNQLEDFPLLSKDVFVKRVGSDRAEQLEILARKGAKGVDKEKIFEELKEKLRGLE